MGGRARNTGGRAQRISSEAKTEAVRGYYKGKMKGVVVFHHKAERFMDKWG